MKKILCLIAAIILLSGGWLGYSYYSFQIKIDEKISSRDLKSVSDLLGLTYGKKGWEETKAGWILNNIPQVKKNIAFKKGWLLSQSGDSEGAIKEFRKAGGSEAIYNTTTIALAGGRESIERLAEDYIKVLGENPEDFQAKVNLEIIRILQNQAKQQIQQQGPGESDGKNKKKIKKYRPGDKENQGSETGNEGVRY